MLQDYRPSRKDVSVHVQHVMYLRGCLHDLALPGCNEAWDPFNVLKIEISCCTCALAKLFRGEYFKVI